MKTIERLDFPIFLYVMFQDEPRRHESAVIVFTHGAPAYVRASSPFAIYPWENIKHIIRVADETMEIADELKTARADARRLSTLLVSVVSRVSAAFGRPEPDPLDPGAAHDLAGNVKAICDDLASVTEQRDVLKRQLEELRAEMQEGDSVKRVLQRQVDRLRHEPVPSQPLAEPNADNRDSYRGTALRAGAKDCTLFVGPKPTDLTFVVEMREGAKVFDVVAALEHEHGLQPEAYRIREVRAPMP